MKTLFFAAMAALVLVANAHAGQVVTARGCVLTDGHCVNLDASSKPSPGISGNPAPVPAPPVIDI